METSPGGTRTVRPFCSPGKSRASAAYLGGCADKQEAIKARRRGEELHDSFLAWYYENHLRPAPAAERTGEIG